MKRIQIFLTFVTLLGAFLIREASSLGSDKIEILASDTVQLKQLLEHQSVSAMFPVGSYLKGRIREVRTGSILIEVQKSEGTSALSRGDHLIPTSRFSTFQITRYHGNKRLILSSSLIGAGFVAGFLAGLESDFETNKGKAALVLLPAAGGIGGYFFGKSLDRKELTILIK
jgi:hypothetical protein